MQRIHPCTVCNQLIPYLRRSIVWTDCITSGNWFSIEWMGFYMTWPATPAITAVPLSLGMGQRKLWEKQQQPEMPVWRDPVWLIDRAIDPYLAQVISDQNVLGSDISIIRLFDNIERVKGAALKNGVKVKDVRVCVLSFLWFLWIIWMLSPHHKGCVRTIEEVDDIRTELLLYPFQYYVCCFIRDSLRCTKRNERTKKQYEEFYSCRPTECIHYHQAEEYMYGHVRLQLMIRLDDSLYKTV